MLKYVFFAIAGMCVDACDPKKRHILSADGMLNTIEIANDVRITGLNPAVIFTDDERTAIHSAYVAAGVLCPRAVVTDRRFRHEINHQERKQGPMRKAFRTSEGARDFLSESCELSDDVKTVLLMTDVCWGLCFGGTWPRSALSLFDLEQQKFVRHWYHGPGI